MTRSTSSTHRLLLACTKGVRLRLIAAAVLGAGASACAVSLAATSGWLIARAAQHPPVLTLMVAAVLVRTFGIGRGVLRYGERLAAHDAALRVVASLRERIFAALIPLAPIGLSGSHSGDLLSRVGSEVDAVQDLYVRALLPAAGAFLIGLAAVACTAVLLPAAAITLVVALLLGGVGVPLIVMRAEGRASRNAVQARSALAVSVVDMLEGSRELLAFNASEAALERVEAADQSLAKLERRAALGLSSGTALFTVAAGFALWSALRIGIPAVRSGALAGVMLTVVVLLAWAAPEVVADLPGAGQVVRRARAAAQRLLALMASPIRIAEPPVPRQIPRSAELRLRGIVAGYPSEDAVSPRQPVLLGTDLELSAGTRVVIVGASGAGKSTLLAVLLRFLDFDSGSFTIDTVSVRDLRSDDVRRVIGCCQQQPHLFDSTIRANLLVGDPDANDGKLSAALHRVGLGEWLELLPHGLDTLVGPRGTEVSGGQLRRIALAQVLLGDFPVVLFDEPTEGLDEAAAQALISDVLIATRDRAVLIVTHRIEWFEEADEVFLLDSGRL
ncbi:MAG TPA: thiol reductant ABC exporter subunit CydC, partial [Acidothermaceae bacterium]|nr:thiol reductant ABC exporter subunit CydC [Acidothermaceae bacterium]